MWPISVKPYFWTRFSLNKYLLKGIKKKNPDIIVAKESGEDWHATEMFCLKLLCPALILLCNLRSSNSLSDEGLDIMQEGE